MQLFYNDISVTFHIILFLISGYVTVQDDSSQVTLSVSRSKAQFLKSLLVITSVLIKTFFCLLQSTPIQGSKLRLPGYLSGKGFQSGEEGSLINTAILKARSQTAGELKTPPPPQKFTQTGE